MSDRKSGLKYKTPDELPDEFIARVKDKCDNLLGAMKLPLRPELHLKAIKLALEELSRDARAMYVAMEGDDPWEDQPAAGV